MTATVTEPTQEPKPERTPQPTELDIEVYSDGGAAAGPLPGGPVGPGGAGSAPDGPEAASPKGHGRDWSMRHRWINRNPLRVKLVAAMLALVTFALFVVGVGSVFALRDYLIGRVDSHLQSATQSLEKLVTAPQVPNQTDVVWLPPSDYVVAVQGNDGSTDVVTLGPYGHEQLPAFPTDLSTWSSKIGEPFTYERGGMYWRLRVTSVQGHIVVIGEDLASVNNAVGRLVLINTLVGVAVLLALAMVGVWLVRASLRPLAAMERTARAIAGGDLTQRVPELDPRTELGQFSAAMNTMLSQVEAAFLARASSEHRAVRSEERMRQFVADASHELRTPLTTIRGFAELYRQGAAPDPADVLRRIEDEAARMGLLVEDLLLLARLDEERPLQIGPVALADLIEDAAAAAHAVAPERNVQVDIQQPPQGLVVLGDEARLRQVIANLVTNAITHTPEGTAVNLRLRADDERYAIIEISDQGPGLAPEQAEHVFERFYRVDKARTRRAASMASGANGLTAPHSGSGLGLAIVAALVAAHQGSVEVTTAPGRGATFRVRLPLIAS